MPFKSKAQQKYMFANMPKMADRWAHETPSIKSLPEHVKAKAKARPPKEGSAREERGESPAFERREKKSAKGEQLKAPKPKKR